MSFAAGVVLHAPEQELPGKKPKNPSFGRAEGRRRRSGEAAIGSERSPANAAAAVTISVDAPPSRLKAEDPAFLHRRRRRRPSLLLLRRRRLRFLLTAATRTTKRARAREREEGARILASAMVVSFDSSLCFAFVRNRTATQFRTVFSPPHVTNRKFSVLSKIDSFSILDERGGVPSVHKFPANSFFCA